MYDTCIVHICTKEQTYMLLKAEILFYALIFVPVKMNQEQEPSIGPNDQIHRYDVYSMFKYDRLMFYLKAKDVKNSQ